MKKSTLWIICFFLLQSFSGYSQVTQEQLQGDWIVVNITMADGSMVVNSGMDSSTYTMYSFINDTLQIKVMPKWGGYNEPDQKYKLRDSSIVCNVMTYKILYLSKDSLVIVDINDKIESSKRYHYQLVNRRRIIKTEQAKQQNTDTFMVTSKAIPLLKGNIFDPEYNKTNNVLINIAEISGVLYFDLIQQKIIVDIEHSKESEKGNLKFISFIENSFPYWDLNGFTNYAFIKAPFFFEIESSPIEPGPFSLIRHSLRFYPIINGVLPEPLPKVSRNNFLRSNTLFKKGIKLYKKDKLSEALSYFEKSYQLNPENLDALYNMGSIYFKLGDVNAACTCYLKLKNMGQKEAAEIYDQYCKEE